jgi:two-component system, sensor histidine kinase and response regulator
MQKILIIDDDVVLLERIQAVLRLKGFDTLTATSGKSGVDLVRCHLPSLIVCDVNMDEGDGYAALEAIRQDPATAAIPFILMTGQADYPGMRQGMDLGADDYLAKPFTMEALLASVEARLHKVLSVTHHSQQKLDELRATISSIVPHELKTPLTSILEFTDILRTGLDSVSREKALEMLQHIHDAGLRLRQLIENNILCSQLFLKTVDPRRQGSFGSKCAEHATQFIASIARSFAHARQRTIDFNCESSGGTVAIAPEHLAKVVEELLDNAFKFSNPESTVQIQTQAGGDCFFLAITDSGRGMTPEQIANIGAFVQFDRATHEQQGAGLGLAVVKRLAELHDGSVSVASEVGHGTTVKINLPLYSPLNSSEDEEKAFNDNERTVSALAINCKTAPNSDTACQKY